MKNFPKPEMGNYQSAKGAVEKLIRETDEQTLKKELAESLNNAARATRDIGPDKAVDPSFFNKVFTV